MMRDREPLSSEVIASVSGLPISDQYCPGFYEFPWDCPERFLEESEIGDRVSVRPLPGQTYFELVGLQRSLVRRFEAISARRFTIVGDGDSVELVRSKPGFTTKLGWVAGLERGEVMFAGLNELDNRTLDRFARLCLHVNAKFGRRTELIADDEWGAEEVWIQRRD